MQYIHGGKGDRTMKLNILFENIVENASVDYAKREVLDIQAAVKRVLEKVTMRMNHRGIYKISSVQPCGSMTEKMSVIKTATARPLNYTKTKSDRYIEFDFLAVLEKPCKIKSDIACPGCLDMYGPAFDIERLGQLYESHILEYQFLRSNRLYWEGTSDVFKKELNYCLASACNCFSFVYRKIECIHADFSFKSTTQGTGGCSECTITMDTGYLQVASKVNIGPMHCSTLLVWTSHARSIIDIDDETLQPTEPIKILPIYVDFIPALRIFRKTENVCDLEHNYLIVAKRCNLCNKNWRVSDSLQEVDFVLNNMSDKHKMCFKVLKFITEHKLLTTYYLKLVAIHHSSNCSDSSKDCVNCVTDILDDLLQAFKDNVLMSFHGNYNVLSRFKWVTYQNEIEQLIKCLADFKSWTEFKLELSNTYSSSNIWISESTN